MCFCIHSIAVLHKAQLLLLLVFVLHKGNMVQCIKVLTLLCMPNITYSMVAQNQFHDVLAVTYIMITTSECHNCDVLPQSLTPHYAPASIARVK